MFYINYPAFALIFFIYKINTPLCCLFGVARKCLSYALLYYEMKNNVKLPYSAFNYEFK